jgi:hypothetical protein
MVTEQQLAKHRRQQCINLLEKISKNLFRMLHDETIGQSQLVTRFAVLYKKLSQFDNVYLDTEYHRATRNYVDEFAKIVTVEQDMETLRSVHATKLNRLQKLRNASEYKRDAKKVTID